MSDISTNTAVNILELDNTATFAIGKKTRQFWLVISALLILLTIPTLITSSDSNSQLLCLLIIFGLGVIIVFCLKFLMTHAADLKTQPIPFHGTLEKKWIQAVPKTTLSRVSLFFPTGYVYFYKIKINNLPNHFLVTSEVYGNLNQAASEVEGTYYPKSNRIMSIQIHQQTPISAEQIQINNDTEEMRTYGGRIKYFFGIVLAVPGLLFLYILIKIFLG